MINWLISKFDKWWLGQINIGLLQMTHAEYLAYRLGKRLTKLMMKANPATGEPCFSGINIYITTNENPQE